MADPGKSVALSVVVGAVDRATRTVRQVVGRVGRLTARARQFTLGRSDEAKAWSEGWHRRIGRVEKTFGSLLRTVGIAGGAVAAAAVGFKRMTDSLDELGDTAEKVGVSVDFLAQLRYAAKQSGASVEELDSGLEKFTTNLGRARAGTGRMAGFLKKVNPVFLQQLKGAKGTEKAFDVVARAMEQIKNPADRAALAAAAFGPALAPLLARGPKGIQELRERFVALAGPMKGAVDAAGKVDGAFHDVDAATQGVKAAFVEKLGPAVAKLLTDLADWIGENRERIAAWAKEFAEKLPARIERLIAALQKTFAVIRPVWKALSGLIGPTGILATILGVKLVFAVHALGKALLFLAANPVVLIAAAIAALILAGIALVKNWDEVSRFLRNLWDDVCYAWKLAADAINETFSAMWEGVKSVFQAGWDFVKPIVDLVIAGMDKIEKAVGWAKDYLGGGKGETTSLAELTAGLQRQGMSRAQAEVQARRMLGLPAAKASSAQPAVTRVKVDFANAPKGTRVTATPGGKGEVDLSVGMALVTP